MKTYIISLLITTAMLFTGCNSRQKKDNHSTNDKHEHTGGHDSHKGHNHAEGEHNDHDGHNHSEDDGHNHGAEGKKEHTDDISFTEEQAKAVGLTVEAVTAGVFNQVIKTSGQVQAAQGDEASIVATSNGIVSFVNSSITEGSAVRAGEAIVIVSAKNLQDGDPTIKARIEYETAQKDFQRAEELVKDQIISAKEFEQSRLRYETAKAVYKGQSANITTSGVKVTSPINGYIKNRLVGQGEYVSVGQPIVTVSQNKRLQLRAEVSENYFKSLKSIGSANFKMSYDKAIYKLSDLNGRLLSFGKASDGQSFYIPVTFEFDNIGDVIPGSFAEVFLLSTPQNNVLSVPTSSITEEQGLYFVYLKVHDEEYKKQEVSIGQNNGERVQILAGLNTGDKVVTKGVYQVKLAAISSVMPEGHSH
jgi:RND family efflux transporter MFP subunit